MEFNVKEKEKKSAKKQTKNKISNKEVLQDEVVSSERAIVAKKRHHIKKEFLEIYPGVGFVTDRGYQERFYIKLKKSYVEVLKMHSYNLYGIPISHLEQILNSYENQARLYVPDVKELEMSLKIDTSKQIQYYKDVLKECKNENQKRILNRKIAEFQFIGNHRYDKEFFVFLYGYSPENLESNVNDFLNYSGTLKFETISAEKKQEVFRKLNNIGENLI